MFDNYGGYGSGYGYGYGGPSQGAIIWIIISIVIAIVGGLVLYFTFMSKKNRGRFKGFLGGLYEFLHFRKIVIETILKIAYLILAIAVTLGSFAFIGQSFLAFLVILILGNLLLRISYEMTMMMVGIWRNTTDMSNALHKMNHSQPTPDAPAATPSAPGAQRTTPAAPAQKTCPNCGAPIPEGDRFCRKCGTPVA